MPSGWTAISDKRGSTWHGYTKKELLAHVARNTEVGNIRTEMANRPRLETKDTQTGPRRNPVLAMVGFHLAVVALLVADLAYTWAFKGLGPTQVALLAAAVLWFLVGAGLLVRVGSASKLWIKSENALVSLTSIVIVLVLLEAGLRIVAPDPSRYLRPPNTRSQINPEEQHTPGIRGVANFTTNEWGLRGPSAKPLSDKSKALRIITIGGSTTACEFLDDLEDWSHLLMQYLNYRQDKKFVHVANAGMNGHNTADHLALLNRFAIEKNADVLIFLVGINDFVATLALEGRSTQVELRARASSTSFSQPPRYPFYTRSRLYALAETLRPFVGLGRNPSGAEWYAERRRIRAQAPIVPMPDLALGVQEYQMRVRDLAEQCRLAGKRCAFLTQPTIWRSDLTPDEDRLLFYGWTGSMENPKGFVRPADLAQGMRQFNEALLTLCKVNSLECYDLASAIPKDATAFYDDCHFNEGGARLVARFLADSLFKDLGHGSGD
jgi:lysophospholipase L1-like esterase